MVGRTEAARARKSERAVKYSHTVYDGGKTVNGLIFETLDLRMAEWLELKRASKGSALYSLATARGIVRGLSLAIATIQVHPYDPTSRAKQIERESLERVRHE